jgi:hypothetical protein
MLICSGVLACIRRTEVLVRLESILLNLSRVVHWFICSLAGVLEVIELLLCILVHLFIRCESFDCCPYRLLLASDSV